MELIKPSKMDVNVQENNGTKGILIAEPLERGFGLTLGNAIRRVLLSSLQGAAITSVKIKGVVHEFSTIPGVKEDLTDILLNLKSIAVKVHSPGLKKMYIKATGAGEIRAGNFETDSETEIMNKNQLIMTLDR
jgi:DNA-directed RNA polymerase subunit alpha